VLSELVAVFVCDWLLLVASDCVACCGGDHPELAYPNQTM